MSLKDIEEKLYKRDAEKPQRKSRIFRELSPRGSDENPFAPAGLGFGKREPSALWIREREERKKRRKSRIRKIIFFTATILLLAGGLLWAAIVFRKSAFSEEKVMVSITAPGRVESGELATLEINYRNLNRVKLKDAVLRINYSEHFKPQGNLEFESEGPSASKYNIGDIEKYADGKISLKGKFFGPRDCLVYIGVKLEYNSSSFSSRFAAEDKAGVHISSSPLMLEISGPRNAASGDKVNYTVTYQNTGQDKFLDLKVKIDYPEGFSFLSSEPLPAKDDNIWYVGNLNAGGKGEVKLSGTLEGSAGSSRTIKVYIGEFGENNEFVSYSEAESVVEIVGSPIVLNQTIGGKEENIFVDAGDVLRFNIKYKNTSRIGLRDVVLTEEIKSPILDYASLDLNRMGAFNSSNSTITWKASDISDFKLLEPGEEGEVSFSVKIKDVIPVNSSEDKNYSFTAVAKMDSPDVPTPEGMNKVVASNILQGKLNSKLIIAREGYYNDSVIRNSGPIPPKVGEETTFSIHLKLKNVSNDVSDAKVTVKLPSGINWKNNFVPAGSSVVFNERTNEMVWEIGTMPAGLGLLTGPRELTFQVGVTPSQNQVGEYVPLISETVFSAKDNFTGQDLSVELGEKSSDLKEDISIGGEGGRVVE